MADSDNPKDGYVLATELYLYIHKVLDNYNKTLTFENRTKTQTPRFGKITMSELSRGDFVFPYTSGVN
jgi:hypothetical protein